MIRLTQLFFICTLLSLTGCAHLATDNTATDNTQTAAIWDSKNSRWVDKPTLVKELQNVHYVVVGELHQSDYLRDQLLGVLKDLHNKKWLKAVALDSLDPKLNSEESTWLEQLEKKHPALKSRYKALVEWLEHEDIPLIAAAVPLDKLKSMKQKKARDWLKEQTHQTLTEQQIDELKNIMASSHPDSLSKEDLEKHKERTDYMVAAQQLQDYFMARMLLAVKEHSIMITRAFHARNDLGMPVYIKAAQPNANVKSLLMVSTMDDTGGLADYLNETSGQYDFIWLKSLDAGFLLAPKHEAKGEIEHKHDAL
ncbi:hypothetical protein ACH42_06010 [Endozoicomonas sp. (ex Bugula neritina AB1)]|nr:hypothetical protein ACH42_06010 [Endozoicomonas sp. (ex Bugula neritina AB1)]